MSTTEGTRVETTGAVRARGTRKRFGDVVALDGVDLDVGAGTVHGLVGPNGAGKTTLLGLLLGLTVADGGRLEVLGEPVGRGLDVPDGVAGFVGGPGLYPALTARQNLRALAALRGGRRGHQRDRGVDEALAEVGLTDVGDDRVRGFSLGMRQRLGLAAALLTRPRLLVLDEPSNGLDPAGAHHVHRVITELADRGAAVVLSSHRMDDLAALCSEVTILDAGRAVFTGPVDGLAARSGHVDHRLVAGDPVAARRLAAGVPGLTLREQEDPGHRRDPGAVVVRGPLPAVDELLVRLVREGVAVRELGPLVPPLEAAYLALTRAPGPGTDGPPRPAAPPEPAHAPGRRPC